MSRRTIDREIVLEREAIPRDGDNCQLSGDRGK
jgi:hypothetical protein